MTANTSSIVLTTLKDLKTLGRPVRKGDIVVPGSMASKYVFNKLKGELAEEAKRYVSGEINRMKGNAQLWAEIPASNGEAKTGCDALVENAFTPDMTDRQSKTNPDREFSLLDKAMLDFKASEAVVDCGFASDPEDGEHVVTVAEYREYQGRNGRDPFIVFTFREVNTGKTWEHLLSVPGSGAIREFLFSISRNNKGCLENQKLADALRAVTTGKVKFSVWTTKNDRGRILTYLDLDRYEKYLYIQSKRSADKEVRNQRRADNEAIRNAEREASKAPWED